MVKPEDRKKVAHELADCLIYLLDLANLADIDLDDAFRVKEEMNNKKTWARGNNSDIEDQIELKQPSHLVHPVPTVSDDDPRSV